MKQLILAIFSFIQTAVATSLIGSTLSLIAGEVRLAVLKKAGFGSSKLCKFTERVTGVKLDL
jgi:hypothetical protein